MNKALLVLSLLFVSPVFGQAPVDLNKGQLTWIWSQGNGLPAEGFRMKCGLQAKVYLQITDIPNPAARSVLIAKIVPTAGTYFCAVTPYNKAAESLSNEVNFTAKPADLVAPTGLTTTIATPSLKGRKK